MLGDDTEVCENVSTDEGFLPLFSFFFSFFTFKEFVLSSQSRSWFVIRRANLSDGKHQVTGFFPQTECNKFLLKHP